VGQFDAALESFEEAYFIAREIGQDPTAASASIAVLGMLGYRLGRFEDAEAWARHAEVDVARADDDSIRALLYSRWGGIHYARGDLDESEVAFRRALEISREIHPPGHPVIAQGLNNLGGVSGIRGDFEEARELMGDAAEIYESTFGPEHPGTGLILGNLAILERNVGNLQKAKELMGRAYETMRRALGEEHPDLSTMLMNQAVLLIDEERHDEAMARLDESIALLTKHVGDTHPNLGLALANRGALLAKTGRYEEGYAELGRAEEVFRRLGATQDDPMMAPVNLGKAEVELVRGAHAEALEHAEMGNRKLGKMSAGPDEKAEARFILAQAMWETETDRPKALVHAEEALEHLAEMKEIKRRRRDEIEAWLAERR
jgi:tetratricopeptide (TPR) repeat protein